MPAPIENWPPGTGPNEIGPNEIGPNEIGPNEIGPNEIGPAETLLVESRLAESLRDEAGAGSPIDPAPLLHQAVARGRRLRTRRRFAVAVPAVVAVLGLTIGGLVTARRPAPVEQPQPARPVPSASADLAVLPEATGVPGARTDPAAVAGDPNVLHFSVDAFAGHSFEAAWQSNGSYESARVLFGGGSVYVAIARERGGVDAADGALKDIRRRQVAGAPGITVEPSRATTVGGVAATVTVARDEFGATADGGRALILYSYAWQPVPGLWAEVEVRAGDEQQALAYVGEVSFDRAQRCIRPFTVGAPPAGATLRSCAVAFYLGAPDENQTKATGENQTEATGENQTEATGENQTEATGENQTEATGENQAGPTGEGRPLLNEAGLTYGDGVHSVDVIARPVDPAAGRPGAQPDAYRKLSFGVQGDYPRATAAAVLGSVKGGPDPDDPSTW